MSRKLLKLRDRIRLLWFRRWMILGITLGAAVVALCLALFVIPKQYTATSQIYFNAYTANKNKSMTQKQLENSRGLADSYVEYMKEPFMLTRAVKKLPSSLSRQYTAPEIDAAIKIQIIGESDVIQFDTTLDTPADAKILSDYFAKFVMKEMVVLTRVGNYYLFTNASIPSTPSFPIPWIFGLAGGVLGLILSLVLAFSVKQVILEERDIKQIIRGGKVLGIIPHNEIREKTP